MKNERGQTLLGVLIAVAISGILMMTVADINVIMVKNNATARADSDMLAYINTIRANIQNQTNATTMLAGNSISGLITLNDPLMPSQTLGNAGYKQQLNDAWQVQSVNLENPIQTGNIFRFTLTLIIQRDVTRIAGGSVSRRIVGDVYCQVRASKITSCGVSSPSSDPDPSNGNDGLDAKNQDEINRSCSSIGGQMSDGVCSFHTDNGGDDQGENS